MRDWRKQQNQLESLKSKKKKRLKGTCSGRKAAHPEIEELVEWIESLRAENLKVTRAAIQQKALELYQGAGEAEFVVSKGWLEKFLNRNHLPCEGGQQLDRNCPVTSFLK